MPDDAQDEIRAIAPVISSTTFAGEGEGSLDGIASFAANNALHEQLDSIVTDYQKQATSLPDACKQIKAYTDNAVNLTDVQRDGLFVRYVSRLEQMSKDRSDAIARG